MFDRLGVGPGGSLVGAVAAVLALIPFAFHRWGERLRARSRFAAASLGAQPATARGGDDEERQAGGGSGGVLSGGGEGDGPDSSRRGREEDAKDDKPRNDRPSLDEEVSSVGRVEIKEEDTRP